MPKRIEKGRIGMAAKIVAAILSAGTAIVTIFTFARSYGLIGAPAPAVLTVGNLGVSWVGLAPAFDTATSIGDTVRLAATVTDDNGTALIGATIRWTSDDPSVAEAIGGGKVVAKRPGTATIVATVGDKLARARVTVRQRVASVRVNGDSVLTLGEDEHRRVAVVALDARGNPVAQRRVAWRSLDTNVVDVDTAGWAEARSQGRAEVAVAVDDASARLAVSVVPLPGALEVKGGDAQRAVAGAALAQPVVVRLISTHGRPIAGAAVRFRTADGRGVADPATVVTDARGSARTSWTLAPLPGRQRLIATSERLDSAAVLVAEAEPVAANTRLTSLRGALMGRAGTMLGDTVAVRVADTPGVALADVPVTWWADDRGRVTPLGERTDSLGEARAVWTLGPATGAQHVRVRVGGGRAVAPLVIGALATAGPPASIVVVAGDAQKGRVGSALAKPVVLKVVDSAGNGVSGAAIALHASAGELADSTPVADSTGRARIVWTMPRAAGAHRLSVRADGIAKLAEVTATALAAPAANVTFVEPKSDPVVGKPLGKWVEAAVTDVYGNPIAGAVVTFSTRSGTVAPSKVATDAKGVARTRWTLGTKTGDQTLGASVASGESGARSALTVAASARGEMPVRQAGRERTASARRGRQ